MPPQPPPPPPPPIALQATAAYIQFIRCSRLITIFLIALCVLASSPILIPLNVSKVTYRKLIPRALHRRTYGTLKILCFLIPAFTLVDPANMCNPHPRFKAYSAYHYGFFVPYRAGIDAMEVWKGAIGMHYRGYEALAAAKSEDGRLPALEIAWRILYAMNVGSVILCFYIEILIFLLRPLANWLRHQYELHYWQAKLKRSLEAIKRREEAAMERMRAAQMDDESSDSENAEDIEQVDDLEGFEGLEGKIMRDPGWDELFSEP
ncbi:hypothetical protein BDV96DRAFT_643010 [Lophiotrema nucula]|uniref:Uncharacterized protein n=1 Tax=Lophiotrema nucula TaxID=690887 RepID=A0A6A5ZH28_9PLEO|nr:hypothetical protein BDV96DRAFT_643010 [Lophiotrema nucula]